MGERATYHHGDLRHALVSAALDLIRENGVAGLSVAEAARRAGVSSAAPYRHFTGRAALLSAAATALATELLDELVASTGSGEGDKDDGLDVDDAIERLVALTRTRIQFSLTSDLGFDVIYAEELRDVDDPERRAVTRELFEMFLWPAMTITGDAEAAGRLLRQASALAQGYIAIARATYAAVPSEAATGYADEAAEAVRLVARAASRR